MRDEEIEECEKNLQHKTNKWRISKDSPDQAVMYKAADYHDQWFTHSVAPSIRFTYAEQGVATTCAER